jgi:hypothetical protein
MSKEGVLEKRSGAASEELHEEADVRQRGCEDERYDGGQLDEDVDRRSRGVFEGVAHGVA